MILVDTSVIADILTKDPSPTCTFAPTRTTSNVDPNLVLDTSRNPI